MDLCEDEEPVETTSAEEDDYYQDYLDASLLSSTKPVSVYLLQEIEIAMQLEEIQQLKSEEIDVFRIQNSSNSNCDGLIIALRLSFIRPRFREWWGLQDDYMYLRLSFDVTKYRLAPVTAVNASLPTTSRNIAMAAIERFVDEQIKLKWCVKNEEEQIEDASLLLWIVDTLVEHMKELGNFCVQCGLVLPGAHPLLSVCDDSLCCLQRDLLRESFKYSMGPRLWTDTAGLLNFLFYHANISRRNLICKPDPIEDSTTGFVNVNSVIEALKGYCTHCVFSTWNSYEKFRDNPTTKAKANLLYWLSDRFPVICRLPPRLRVGLMSTNNQYVLPPVSSDKERRFQNQLNAVNGQKFYAFHGSPVENWYKILCEGLKVCSGTKLQLVGTAHGDGIYLGKEPTTSEPYARRHACFGAPFNEVETCTNDEHLTRNKYLSQGTYCLALVEVADNPRKYKDCDWCYVVQDPDILQIRALFIYDSGTATPTISRDNFAAEHPEMKQIQQAMDFFIQRDFESRLFAIFDSESDEAMPDAF